MSGFHLLPPSWTSGASVIASSEASPSTAGENLLFVQPSRKWRSAGLGPLRLTFSATAVKPWDSVALLRHNGSATGTMQVFAAAAEGDVFTSPDYQSAAVDLLFPGDLSTFTEYDSWFYAGSIRNHQYLGIEILDASNPDGYFQCGVVIIGVKFTPGVGPDLGAKTGRDDPSTTIRLLNGEAIVRPKRGIDVGNWVFPMQSPTETIRWREINRTYGSKIPMVMKWDPIPFPQDESLQQHTFYYGYAQWRQGGPITYSNGHGLNEVEVGIEEV